MKLLGYKIINDNEVIEYYDDGSKMKVKGLNGYKVGISYAKGSNKTTEAQK